MTANNSLKFCSNICGETIKGFPSTSIVAVSFPSLTVVVVRPVVAGIPAALAKFLIIEYFQKELREIFRY